MTGIEFAVLSSKPPSLFVIGKQQRHSPSKVSLLACYYVLNGSIYMAPDLLSLIDSRLVCMNQIMIMLMR